MLDIVEGRLVTHKHDRENWRLRDMVEHPRDPNWETGQYTTCHKLFRLNKKLQSNTVVFDLVFVKGRKFPVIRSVFVIKDINIGIIKFGSFLFSDGEPLELKRNLTSTSYGPKLSKEESVELLRRMKNNSYNEYKIGEKPKSISAWDWERMKMAASSTSNKPHSCQ